MSAFPTLEGGWEATGSGCLRSDDYWIWQYSDVIKDARTVLGGPSQTTACLPSSWDESATYLATACPEHYTAACQDKMTDPKTTIVTCCPTVSDFGCVGGYTAGINHNDQFRCVSQWLREGQVPITHTDFIAGSQSLNPSQDLIPSVHLFALAILYTQSTPTSSATTLTSTSRSTTGTPTSTNTGSPESSDESSGLSSGAAAGIGVGVTLAVVLMALAGWFVWRRKRAARALRGRQDPGPYVVDGPPNMTQQPDWKAHQSAQAFTTHESGGTPLNEMANNHPRRLHELSG
ncbi:hypothetical protein F4780DRAFT_94226 [Xylariomycetidae sp. FL0641]|nr:hypothetical protein F4780DRAFT_94226 [Xylariomycetidae sp. FL0641]